MQKHEIVPLIKSLGRDVNLKPLEMIAEVGYKRYHFDSKIQGSTTQIELYIDLCVD